MFAKFNTDKRYFNKYFLSVIAMLAVANGMLFFFATPDFRLLLLYLPALFILSIPDIYLIFLAWLYALAVTVVNFGFHAAYLAGIPIAIVLTFIATALLHNASHSNFRPRWFCRGVGEAMGLFQMVAFPSWVIVHILHHRNSDDPVLDPHPPLDKGYVAFLTGMRKSISKVIGNYYFSLWGNNAESARNLKEVGIESQLSMFLQALFWYLVLGPQVFAWFYIFSIVFKMAHYAWFNYATHIYTQDGINIGNLNHGFYKAINAIAFGLYYHKNHHLRPGLFDPRKL